jgi:hypothetical protein
MVRMVESGESMVESREGKGERGGEKTGKTTMSLTNTNAVHEVP